jgi:hypothetical protein
MTNMYVNKATRASDTFRSDNVAGVFASNICQYDNKVKYFPVVFADCSNLILPIPGCAENKDFGMGLDGTQFCELRHTLLAAF